MPFDVHTCGDLVYHTSSILDNSGIVHGFSTRKGGVSEGCFASLNLRMGGPNPDDRENVVENYRRFCAAVGADVNGTVLSVQVHEDTIRAVTAADAGKGLFRERDYTADALITNEPGLSLMVFSADCGIFLLHDPVSGCIGAIHAGWRGTALNLPAKTVREMGRRYGAKPENIRVAIGAGIGPCCFDTHWDVPEAMLAAFGPDADTFFHAFRGKWQVDLEGINLWRLREAGILEEHLESIGLCTACHGEALYWSHRRDGDARGVQAALIALKGERTV